MGWCSETTWRTGEHPPQDPGPDSAAGSTIDDDDEDDDEDE